VTKKIRNWLHIERGFLGEDHAKTTLNPRKLVIDQQKAERNQTK